MYGALYGDEALEAIFSEVGEVRRMLAFEAALARAQVRVGVIPAAAGEAITEAASHLQPDLARLRADMERAGFPVIGVVRQLREAVGPPYADYVHYGATTQDVMDTARVLQLREGLEVLAARLNAVIGGLAALVDSHRATVMPGRTHSQQALPVPFGLKAAAWLAPLIRHRARLAELRRRVLVVQFGGAAGTLAALGERGTAVEAALAAEVSLGVPPMPWHAQRDAFAEVAGWLSLVTGSLGKMAQDVILLGQSEVGEVRESADASRGGSSTMPQKRNPVLSEVILACARTNASLLSAMHHALIQEHERGTHGWQVEWLTLPRMVTLAGAALRHAAELSRELVVDADAMAHNVAASNGLMLAEAAAFALSAHMPRTAAKALVREACHAAAQNGDHLIAILQEHTTAPLDWDALRDEAAYLGQSDTFIDRVLKENTS